VFRIIKIVHLASRFAVALPMFSGCDESSNRQVLYGPGAPGIRLSAGLTGSTRQKAREVYSNQFGHAMPNRLQL